LATRRPQTMRFFVSLAALVALAACSVSTAHLTDLTLSKSKDMSNPTTTFGASDPVYAQSGVANTPGKVTLAWHFIAENVKGIPPNSLQKSNDVSNDLDADGTSTYTLTPPASGWPTGTYKIVVDLMVDGTQKEEKTTEFTVGQ
jgi:hypothetical protein